MSFSIEGKTAIVTGAANGIGLAIGRHFANQGANVMFVDMDDERLEREVGNSEDDNVRWFAGDLRERLTIANLLSATLDSFDKVDILVNASRQVVWTDPLEDEDDSVNLMLQQNLMAPLALSRLVAQRMIRQGKDQEDGALGAIINLSSVAARRTRPELLGYSIATAALDQMTRSLAVALAPHRIRVNSVAIGSLMSASLKSVLKENDGYRKVIEDNTPMSRIAGPGEMVEAVQYLASDASKFMTGQILTVDGGRTLLDPVPAPAH
ncbi:SDR family NAD(P)-dependent oxidoreductase [Mesobacterium pallidum]|uniref:SDR family NAD(P)-dependent oxidoreductase n=1 Tax=Mesobacterium pallidum TaxID=2872037 RepID=UPI001EE22409|nr:SDR family oxidoreductase [Mesobacterium pallidum]